MSKITYVNIILFTLAAPMILLGGYKEDFAEAQKLFLSKKYAEAISAYEKAEKGTNLPSEIGQAVVRKARAMVALNRGEEAEKFLLERLKDSQFGDGHTRAEAYYDLGVRYENADKKDKALDAYRKGGSTGSSTFAVANCLCRQGIILKDQKKYKEAAECFQKVLSSSFQNSDKCIAYTQMAQLSAFEKDFGKANFLLDEADRVLPAGQKIEIARMRSNVRILENKFEEAIEINRKIIGTPDVNVAFSAEAHSKNAWIYYYKLKDNEKALAELEKASVLKTPWGYDKGLHAKLKATK